MANKILNDFKDELGEALKDSGKDLAGGIKDMARIAKGQVTGKMQSGDNNKINKVNEVNKINKDDSDKNSKIDPVTGRPQIKKPQLQQLTQATQQLQLAKLKKIREQLEEQRLKVTDEKAKLAPIESKKSEGHGPAMPTESSEKAPRDDAVAKTLRSNKSEFKGLVGG